ncbi:WbuC family cupin fold metalloprotein [Pectobacterium versatile]|uniref:WbuC family cupin fold metalloprotein n=1 Tax=Pectobacterium versatile TaxID=2488639 RepID=A0ABU8K1I4_9GAMM|nr:WbuC family cupin fold metalloprotein [Pectobacterium carotovorum]MCH4996224.1 WbuC family cupin fold metalloprotein [Pectobacterium carotovorum]
MRVFDQNFLSDVNKQASENIRKRAHLNLHGDYNEKIQRLFISLIEGSFVEPHYHELPHQWEMFVVIDGIVEVIFYSQEGKELNKLIVGQGQDCCALEIHPFDIHSVRCLSKKALMLEIKEGPFNIEDAKVMVSFNNFN